MNKVILSGRFVANPVSFATQTQTPNSKFDLAVSDSRMSSETYFFPCVCFGTRANYINTYLKKGDFVIIEGRITRKKYTTREGKTNYGTDIVVDDIQLVSNINNSNQYNNNFANSRSNNKQLENEEKVSIDDAFKNSLDESFKNNSLKEENDKEEIENEEEFPS